MTDFQLGAKDFQVFTLQSCFQSHDLINIKLCMSSVILL